MAKKEAEARQPVQLRLPMSVFEYMDKRYRKGGGTVQLQALAAIVAYECVSDRSREEVMEWATRISKDVDAWPELLDLVKKRRVEAPEQQSLLGNLPVPVSSGSKRRLA
jgi:hypothetical protein